MTLLVLILSWLLFGLAVGLIARVLYPGPQPMGFGMTAGVGVAGSFVGGMVGNLVAGLPLDAFHGAGIIGSVIGALIVMALIGFNARRANA